MVDLVERTASVSLHPQFSNRRSEFNILRGNAARIMGAEGTAHPGVADVDIRMMTGRLGCLGHAYDESDSVEEGEKRECLHERVVLALPAGQRLKGFVDRVIVEPLCHDRFQVEGKLALVTGKPGEVAVVSLRLDPV